MQSINMQKLEFNMYRTDSEDFALGPLLVDAYKLMHADLYNEDTELMQGNCIARYSNNFKNKSKFYDETYVCAGVNIAVKALRKTWDKFFDTKWEYVEQILDLVIPSMTGQNDYSRLKALHKLGYLPIIVRSAPEGASIKIGSAFLTVEDTAPEFSWITIYVETFLLHMTWYPCTIATIAREFYRVAHNAAVKYTDDIGYLPWAVHDFSLRGLEGYQAAFNKGPGHLMFFNGSDDVVNCLGAVADYNAKTTDYGSVLATEHSVATSNITYLSKKHNISLKDAEKMWLKKLLKKFTKGILSYVGDSYDYFGLLKDVIPELKEDILARDGTFVLRGDSGVPKEIICGLKLIPKKFDTVQKFIDYVYDVGTYEVNQYTAVKIAENYFRLPKGSFDLDDIKYLESPDKYKISEEEVKGTIGMLWDTFGGTVNSKDLKVLDSHVRIIYGDGITVERYQDILDHLVELGFSPENLVIGVGGGAYQWISRDTLGFAMKATYAKIDDMDVDVFKLPKTDLKKASVKGWVLLKEDPNTKIWYSVDQQKPRSKDICNDEETSYEYSLVRFSNSMIHNLVELADIKVRAKKQAVKS